MPALLNARPPRSPRNSRVTVSPSICIGLVGPLPPPSGGMAAQTLQLARLLKESGLRVELVQVNAPYPAHWIERLRGVRAFVRLLPYVGRLWRCAERVDLLHVMANSGWAWHFFAAPAIWVGRARGRPVVVNYRGGEAEPFLAKQASWVRASMARASLVIVPSGFLEAVFAKHGIRSEVVPNVVDLSRYSPGDPRPPGRCQVIVTRNLEKLYDIPTAIRAFARIRGVHPRARLSIAGSGPERESLERLCAKLGVESAVTFTGQIDNEMMASLYRSADLLLNPSQVDNMPNSLLEGMASGVPIVSTNVGGIPWMVENGKTAMLVPPGDPEAMAAAAERVLSDSALAEQLRIAGRAAVTRFGWDRVRPVLFDAYARALGRWPSEAIATSGGDDAARNSR
jgi:L-malate glycosyltransferase